MADNMLLALQTIYKDSTVPVVLLDDSLQPIWSNSVAQQEHPSFFHVTAFEFTERELLLEQLQRYGSVTCRMAPFPTPSDNVVLIRHGDIIATLPAPATPPSGSSVGADLSGLDMFTGVLRDGINGITLSAQSIEQMVDAEDPKIERLFGNIRRSSYRILRNLQNTALYSRYITGDLTVRKQVCDVGDLIGTICQAVTSISMLPVKIRYNQPNESFLAPVDVRMFERALLNILLNSLLNTRDDNEVQVSLSQTGEQIIITVRDRGAGIQSHNLPRVKEPYFSCVPADDGEPRPGLGLGLPVASIFCHLHGGALLINSEFGLGTTVALSIKAAAEDEQPNLRTTVSAYVTDSFSPVYIEMCDICLIPDQTI